MSNLSTNAPAHQHHQQYLRTRVMTATPEQLQLMLYDGAIRFTEAARAGLDRRDLEAVFTNVTKAQAILTELMSGLRPAHGADLCSRLAGLYRYVYRKLVEVGFEHSDRSAEEALAILRHQRETWAMLLEQLAGERAAAGGGRTGAPAANRVVTAGLSMAA